METTLGVARGREPNRRDLIQLSAVVAASSLVGGAARAASGPASFALDACSRHLQWLRTPAELAKGVTEIGLKGVDLTVASAPGHVDPGRARTDLRSFVEGLRANGIATTAITTAIVDADSPNAEVILDAAAQAGVRHYGWGGLRYDEAQPYRAQLEALKPRVEKLARLNEKYAMKGLYQPRAGAANVGYAFFDLLELFRPFDPRFVAIRYDTGSLLQATPQATVAQLRLGAPYIGGLALKDARVQLDLPTWVEGYFNGPPEQLTGGDRGGDNVGRDGGAALALGGGGKPLPYRIHPVRMGTGMLDLTLLGRTLKDIGFSGPAEVQVEFPLDGVEQGADRITRTRQYVIGMLKHDRLMVEQGFADAWGIDIARPPFMRPRPAAAA
jgi:sugar phosphate isomerase/epimerase